MGGSRAKCTAERKKTPPKVKAASPKTRARSQALALVPKTKVEEEHALMPATRVLFRRNTDHQVDRCMQLKLGMFPRRQLDHNRNSRGENVPTAIKAEIYRLRPSGGHIAMTFWKDMIIEHRPSGSLMDGLQKP